MIDPFEKVSIGHTGVEVTRLGLGGAPLSDRVLAGGKIKGSGYKEALVLIRRAWELGVRYFDTAPMYGSGCSEVRFGRVLPDVPRDSFALSTKAGRLLIPENPDDLEPYSEDGIPHYRCDFDLSAASIRKSLAASLERLRLAAVDILFIHDTVAPDQHSDEEFATALEEAVRLRSEGVVKAIGLGMNEWERSGRLIKRFTLDFVLLAGRYTLLDQSAHSEFLSLCIERGVQLVIGGPFNSGILARDLDEPVTYDYVPAPAEIVSKAKRLHAVCKRYEVDLRAAALQFPFGHPAVISTIPGAGTVAELEDNVRLMQADIPADLWKELQTEGLLPAHAPTP